MPAFTHTLTGEPIWFDLMSSDIDRSIAFYSSLFGWTHERAGEDFGGYVRFFHDGRDVAGAMPNHEGTYPDCWTLYLHTDDAVATGEAIAAHGGQTMFVNPVADLGTMLVATDPSGAAVGAWQAGTFSGLGVHGEPGTPCWFELHTKAYDGAVDFYRSAFGWKTSVMSDTPQFRYTNLGEAHEAKAGIMDASGYLPESVPSFWVIYFDVSDVHESVAQAVALGGSLVSPVEETPFGLIATIADPTGVTCKLRQQRAA